MDRRRLWAAVAAAAVIGAGLVWSHRVTRRRVIDALVADDLRARVTAERARCEASPEAWSKATQERVEGASAPLGVFAFDARLSASVPDTPPISAPLVHAWKRGRAAPRRTHREGPILVHEQLVRLPWSDGPCAVVLLRRRAPSLAAERPPLVPALFTILAPLLIALIALRPKRAPV